MHNRHPLYANVVVALEGKPTPFFKDARHQNKSTMVSRLDGSARLGYQSQTCIATNLVTPFPVTSPEQGICRDASHFYLINTASIQKAEVSSGTIVATNASPFTSLPVGVDHLGSGFESGGYLYIPVCLWNGGGETATLQTIAIYNTSDLSLSDQWDISATSDFNGSGIFLLQSGEIGGVNFFTGTPPDVRMTNVHVFNASTGAYIRTDSLDTGVKGIQGATWDATRNCYFITSFDAGDLTAQLTVFNVDLEMISDGVCSIGMGAGGVIEGVSYYAGNQTTYIHEKAVLTPRNMRSIYDLSGLYCYDTFEPRAFCSQSDIGDNGTILMKVWIARTFNYASILDNEDDANHWEAWTDTSNRVRFRIHSGASADTANGTVVGNTEYWMHFGWEKDGANAICSVGLDGSWLADSILYAWVTPPSTGLWLGGKNAGNSAGDLIYREIALFDKKLSDAEIAGIIADYDALFEYSNE